jgi:hypothetical protein
VTQAMLAAAEAEARAALPAYLRSPIFLPTERVAPDARVRGLRRIADVLRDDWPNRHRPRLRALREIYQGCPRCFVVGNGPSLARTDLGPLRGEVTFGTNGIFLLDESRGFSPTFYVVEDHLVAEDRAERINSLRGPLKMFPANLAYCIDEDEDTLFFDHRPRKSFPHGFDFSTDAAECTYAGCTVTFTCLQLAFHLGFRRIILVGVDCSYAIPQSASRSDAYGVGVLDMKDDDPNHFHPDYFGKGYRWHDPQVDKMKQAYAEARRVTEQAGVEIVNATIGGELEVFPRIEYSSLFEPAASSAG